MRDIATSPRRGDTFHHRTFAGGCTVRAMRCFVRSNTGTACVHVHLVPDVGVELANSRRSRVWSVATWGDLVHDAKRAALQPNTTGEG